MTRQTPKPIGFTSISFPCTLLMMNYGQHTLVVVGYLYLLGTVTMGFLLPSFFSLVWYLGEPTCLGCLFHSSSFIAFM